MSTTHHIPSPRSRIRRLRGERGAAIVEFSLVFVIFIALLYGLIAFGLVLALKQSVTNSAAEGARAAIGAPDTEAQLEASYKASRDGLTWLGSKCCTSQTGAQNQEGDQLDAPLVISPTEVACDAGDPSSPRCIQVAVTYDYGNHPLVPALQLPGFGFLFPDTITSEATVQLPYSHS